MDTSALIDGLKNPNAYPHPVDKIELMETHISWVLLTGPYAYKIKKPMNFGFLDFSSLDKREFFCAEEIRLNRRFAPELYLDSVAITLEDGQPRLGGAGDAVEYAVRMTQFDHQRTLDILAGKGELNADDIREIGTNLASFHQDLAKETAPASDLDPQPGTPAAVWAPIEENFDQINPLLERTQEITKVKAVSDWSAEQFRQLEPLIADRYAQGFVRECHGDLHLGNMVQLGEGVTQRVCFFDSIEFNQSFRQIDIACELAFTVMDLEARQMPEAANSLLNTYLEQGGDFAGLALVNFYKVYFAIVRAKVNLLQIAHLTPSEIAEHANYANFSMYLDLAHSYSAQAKPFVAITSGLSGSGKSTAAREIAAATGAIVLRSDVERKRLFGLAPDAPSDKSIYSAQASTDTFARLQALVTQVTAAGLPCIVDATFLQTQLRQQFQQQARDLQLPFHILQCSAPDAVMAERLNAREAAATDASEATVAVMRDQQGIEEALSAEEERVAIAIDTTATLPLADISARLGAI